MKFSYLAVIVPMKWLPQNTEQARTQAWAAVSQLLLPNLGKYYGRFYPATAPWRQTTKYPFGVVLGREDPVAFLNLFYHAKKKQEDAISFHSTGMLRNINLDRTSQIGDVMICHVTADETNEALKGHSLWHLAMMAGTPLPDCGLYYLEQKSSVINPELEKAVSTHPGDYALCAVTLEDTEGAT